MAICLQCGALMHDEDAINHVCNLDDVIQKGQLLRRSGIIENFYKI